jgi:hypothetical protein
MSRGTQIVIAYTAGAFVTSMASDPSLKSLTVKYRGFSEPRSLSAFYKTKLTNLLR